ncbi:hypothetical protein [Aliivibrio fischeri]|uniref:hypothetical protein n=1 Tax=Aliivibrio fischeri TaxID=668 RepID=UPI00080E8AC7|nr:hypothetical protein [Aliivibrio fischeri]OCH48166.1 hypothetical protein A6E02_08545 [Aliivibrio fischeri]
MKRILLLGMFALTSSSTFATEVNDGVAKALCNINGGEILSLPYGTADLDTYADGENNIHRSLTINTPNPIPGGVIFLESNEVLENYIVDAITNKNDITICTVSNGSKIISYTINSK